MLLLISGCAFNVYQASAWQFNCILWVSIYMSILIQIIRVVLMQISWLSRFICLGSQKFLMRAHKADSWMKLQQQTGCRRAHDALQPLAGRQSARPDRDNSKQLPPSPNSLADSDFFPKQEQSIIIYHLLILWFALSGMPQTESILLLTRTTMIDTAELHKTTWNSKLKDYSVDFLFTQISDGNRAFCLIKTRRIPSHH